MSFPHSIHRAERHHIYRSWIKAFPAILLNCLLLLLIVFGMHKCVHMHETRKARRAGMSRSYSANSF
ncbi:hypothetical protein Y032_0022g572 [Ancylostoma ceylanicum]|uniref:Uncharacterized protein n=1 Tax=Ancylostoma ceylanicum TaxID=53326 RepID=A0A016UZU9_9BILA|nr:hypothetical protein Y032_0022g572 [Ancylostoma ceylanicum]